MLRPKKPVSLEGALNNEAMFGEQTAIALTPQAAAKAAAVDKMTVYLPRAAANRIKQMALDHEKRLNDFLQEGVDLMLAKYGQPSLKDFEQK